MKKFAFYVSILLLGYSCLDSKTKSDDRYIYLVRHAEKMSDSKNPELTEQGRLRAQSLSKVLSSKSITGIYSTDYKRTKGTAAPLSQRLDLPINLYDPSDLEGFSSELKEEIKGNVLVVGHSNSTPTLVNHLLGTTTYKKLDETEYGDLFIVLLSSDKVTSSRDKF